MSSVLDDMEDHLNSQPTPAAAPPTPLPSAPSSAGMTAQEIVQACGLADVLGQSVCLSCANKVLAQDSKKRATLYCSALFRDLEVAIEACTAYQEEASTP